MGEQIHYIITLHNSNEQQEQEFLNLTADFGEYEEWTFNNDEYGVQVSIKDGWRGGGKSCKEIIEEHYGMWLDNNKNVLLKVEARYVENPPTETFRFNEVEE